MQDVSDNYDFFTLEAANALLHGECIEECLGGVLVRSVSRIDDVRGHAVRQKMGNAGLGMANHYEVHLHGQDVVDGVVEGFTFFDRRGRGREINDVGREALLG